MVGRLHREGTCRRLTGPSGAYAVAADTLGFSIATARRAYRDHYLSLFRALATNGRAPWEPIPGVSTQGAARRDQKATLDGAGLLQKVALIFLAKSEQSRAKL
jgi:hypothetical protein